MGETITACRVLTYKTVGGDGDPTYQTDTILEVTEFGAEGHGANIAEIKVTAGSTAVYILIDVDDLMRAIHAKMRGE